MKKTKVLEGQDLLDFEMIDEHNTRDENIQEDTTCLPGAVFKPVVKTQKANKIFARLLVSDHPSVTLHKGGGKIVITPDDVMSAVTLIEIKERLHALTYPIYTANKEKLEAQLLPDVSVEDFANSMRAWSLVGQTLAKHPMARLLTRYGLKIHVSPTLANWAKKEERRLKRELTPFLLPDYADERPLFEKVEAGMVLNCIKDFTDNKVKVFEKGQRYQVLDTARGQGDNATEGHEDGIVKISKIPVSPSAKITLEDSTIYAWTIFQGAMEDHFHYEEKIIYEPKKCMPNKYPGLVEMYTQKLDKMNLELYDHVRVDAVQEACKRSTLNGKLMRMGKTSESIVIALLWGSNRVAIISPRNARLFTIKEFERLGIKDFVVVDSMADLAKPGKFYLMTYSWFKKTSDPHRTHRRKGQSYLHKSYTENKKELPVEHKCPFCSRTLERLNIRKIKSEETGFLLEKIISWEKAGGYICRNANCKAKIDNSGKTGAAWSQFIESDKIRRAKPIKEGMLASKPFAGDHADPDYIGYIDFSLRFHSKCKESSVKGRYCHQCHTADAIWTPAPSRMKVMKPITGKRVHLKDFFTAAIIDEIHTIKSADSDIGKSTRSIRAKRRMGLTGTLMPNTPADSFWPLHWVFKGGSALFPFHQREGATQFYDKFCEYINIRRGHGLKDSRKMLPYLKNPIAFWELMSSKMVRRNYEDPLVQASLAKANRYYPNIEFHRVESTMDPKQAALMVQAINHFENNFNQYAQQAAQQGHLLNQAMVVSQMVYLRIGATCPEYFNTKLAKLGKPAIYDGPLGGGKMVDIQNICATKTAAGEKVVVLSDFVEMRKSLAVALQEHNPIVFDGTWDDTERNEAFEAFLEDSTRKIFIAGTRQIREGTNLSSANTVICCDLLWEPGLQQQAWSRAFTPTSEKRTCNVYMLMAKNSIDEHVYNTFYAKVAAAEQALDRKVINRRAHQVDLRWFVDRVLSDRDGLLEYLKEEGEKGIIISDRTFKEIEDREV